MKRLIHITLLLAILSSCSRSTLQPTDIRPGDLLFYSDQGGMNDAVRESTGQYSHVAMVESITTSKQGEDTIWIIDATQKRGVARRPMTRRIGGQRPYPDVYRLSVAIDTASVLTRARSFIGQPYDNAFLPDNGMMYCSELIEACYLDSANGKPLFEAKPMNWRDAQGRLPDYWIEHFNKLGIPIPEGVPGTNPTDLSQSPLLRRINTPTTN